MWCITCCPNSNKGNVILCLQLICLPANISKLKVKYTLYCHEANIQSTNIKIFEYEQGKAYGLWTASKLLSFEQFRCFNKITLSANIEIIDEIYCDSCQNTDDEIEQFWNQYVKQKEYFHQISNQKIYSFDYKYHYLQQRLNKIENSMQQIANNVSQLTQNMKSFMIHQTQNQQQNNRSNMNGHYYGYNGHSNNYNNGKDNEIYLWLKNTVKLDIYFDVFIQNGIDDMDILSSLRMNDLINIGIDKLGHRIKIMKCIASLTEKM